MRRWKTLISVIVVIIIIGSIIIGVIYGFPWERIIAVNNARKYVADTYGFTVTKTGLSMLVDYPVIVTVSTKENSFDFGVDMSRSDLNDISDDYLECKTKYILAKELNEYVVETPEQAAKAYVTLWTNRIHDFSLTELEADPGIAFEKLENWYYCVISFGDDIAKVDYQVDFKMIYDIYNHIFDCNLKPTEINFSYKYSQDSYLFIKIEHEDFLTINSPEDLAPYFEEAISKKRTN